jgi:type VII secretion protein EccE
VTGSAPTPQPRPPHSGPGLIPDAPGQGAAGPERPAHGTPVPAAARQGAPGPERPAHGPPIPAAARQGVPGYEQRADGIPIPDAARPGAAGHARAADGTPGRGGSAPHGDSPAGHLAERPPRGDRLRSRAARPRTGQWVSSQVAVAMLLAAAVHGGVALAGAALPALALLAATWVRLRGRWAFEWLGVAARYSARRHTAPAGAGPATVLGLVAPDLRIEHADLAGDAAAVLVDEDGLTAVLELGDPAGLLAEGLPPLPSPAALLPPAAADQPPCLIQLLLTGIPAPVVHAGNGNPANAYRQLTEGRLLGHCRAVLAVRVLRAEGWPDADLLGALSGLLRKLPRRLGALPARPLGEEAALRAIAEFAHDDGAGDAVEAWSGLRVGGLTQATFRLRRWPDLRHPASRRLVSRILALPATATTVALTAGPNTPAGTPAAPVDLTVRLAATDAATLSAATQSLGTLLAAERADARRLDGEHLDGLTATLPLGGHPPPDVPGRPPSAGPPPAALDSLELVVGDAGLMLGTNRHGEPVVARLFRPEQTRALVVGGLPCAQLVALRAMALGARVVVQSARPQAWEPFVRGAAIPGESIAVVPVGRPVEVPPASALAPLLVVVDVGPVGVDPRPGAGWQATLVVRDEFTQADADVSARADLIVFQALRPDEAALAGAALGLGDAAQWLTRLRPDMVAVVNRRALRWAALAQTPIERHLIGAPART